MSRETDRFLKSLKKFADSQYKLFSARYGQQFMGILEFPIKARKEGDTSEELSNLQWMAGIAGYYVQRIWKGALSSEELCLEKDLDLPLNPSSWTEEDLKDSGKFYEMSVLTNAQREIADKILDAQWQMKWHQEKLNELLKEKVQPYIQNMDCALLSPPIIIQT